MWRGFFGYTSGVESRTRQTGEPRRGENSSRKSASPTSLLYAVFGCLLLASAAQANPLATIRLENRPAEEVIPVVEPMLADGDAISGRGFTLFVRTSPATLAQVREMIAALDVAARTLQISVFQGSTRALGALGIDGRLRIAGEDGSVAIGTRRDGGNAAGGSVTYGTRGGSASVSATGTRLRLRDNPVHQVRVSEGMAGYIETGKRIPIFSGTQWIGSDTVSGGIEYQDVVTGFYVLPRVNGERVTLEISPFKNALRGGNIETQSARTTLFGRVGEWLLVGGVSEQLERARSGSGSYTSTRSRRDEGIWIRADLVN